MKGEALLFFGAFNPPTVSHVRAAAELAARFPDRDVILIPSKDSYISGWKGYEKNDILGAEVRLSLLREAVGDIPGIFVSDCECTGEAGAYGYTIDTVSWFKKKYERVSIVMGDEKPGEVVTWHRGRELIADNHFVILSRENRDIPENFDYESVDISLDGISSTALREAAGAGIFSEVREKAPENVYRYLRRKMEYNFDAEKNLTHVTEEIRKWFDENGSGCNAVIGISGGKDSSVSAAFCVRALGIERVIGVRMPNGVQPDIDSAVLLCKTLGIKSFEINIKDSVDAVYRAMEEAGINITAQTRINLPPRIRMSTLYAVSQSNNGRVINTCNLSEDYIGYSTRYGDAAGDFAILGGYTVGEVKAMGKLLGLPDELVQKTPSDGLTGKSDEDNIGFTYSVLDNYIRTGEIGDEALKIKIDELHKNNIFKLKPIPYINPVQIML